MINSPCKLCFKLKPGSMAVFTLPTLGEVTFCNQCASAIDPTLMNQTKRLTKEELPNGQQVLDLD